MVKEKIRLRKLGARDLFSFIKTIKNPEVGDRLTYNVPGYLLKGLKEIFQKKNAYKFAILINDKFAGGIVLENIDDKTMSAEVGFYLAREYWGKGIATIATEKILKFGFDNLKLKMIWAEHDINNPASGKVLKRARFRKMKRKKNEKYIRWEKTK
ncbi:MAG: GNAT family N-acetyltransferase [archaeon]